MRSGVIYDEREVCLTTQTQVFVLFISNEETLKDHKKPIKIINVGIYKGIVYANLIAADLGMKVPIWCNSHNWRKQFFNYDR